MTPRCTENVTVTFRLQRALLRHLKSKKSPDPNPAPRHWNHSRLDGPPPPQPAARGTCCAPSTLPRAPQLPHEEPRPPGRDVRAALPARLPCPGHPVLLCPHTPSRPELPREYGLPSPPQEPGPHSLGGRCHCARPRARSQLPFLTVPPSPASLGAPLATARPGVLAAQAWPWVGLGAGPGSSLPAVTLGSALALLSLPLPREKAGTQRCYRGGAGTASGPCWTPRGPPERVAVTATKSKTPHKSRGSPPAPRRPGAPWLHTCPELPGGQGHGQSTAPAVLVGGRSLTLALRSCSRRPGLDPTGQAGLSQRRAGALRGLRRSPASPGVGDGALRGRPALQQVSRQLLGRLELQGRGGEGRETLPPLTNAWQGLARALRTPVGRPDLVVRARAEPAAHRDPSVPVPPAGTKPLRTPTSPLACWGRHVLPRAGTTPAQPWGTAGTTRWPFRFESGPGGQAAHPVPLRPQQLCPWPWERPGQSRRQLSGPPAARSWSPPVLQSALRPLSGCYLASWPCGAPRGNTHSPSGLWAHGGVLGQGGSRAPSLGGVLP